VNALGLIVEYNPFHNGHLHHLEESKRLSNADYVVCIMSGNFIQRGEPALVNKWVRAKMALMSGADLVIELPVVYAMASAEYFAYGAVKLLESMGIISHISFGSEIGELHALDKIAQILHKEPEEFKTLLKRNLSKGISFPSAREAALSLYLQSNSDYTYNLDSILNSSNNILGIEYLKALKKLKSAIIPITIPRLCSSYNSSTLSGAISSATSIRKVIAESSLFEENSDLTYAMPKSSLAALKDEFQHGRGPISSECYETILLYSLRTSSKQTVSKLQYVSEGLENRIKKAAGNAGTLNELIDGSISKRYTRTRIQRILFSQLTGMTASEFENFNNYGGPQYIRVLGFNGKGQKLLYEINKLSILPVIMKTADFKNSCNPLLKRMLEIESIATDNYVLGYKNSEFRKAGQEYTQNVVRI